MSDPHIERLIDKHGEETIAKAFWLQQKIYEEGLDPVHFTNAAEGSMKQVGPMLIKAAIEREFSRDI